jgi:uncharacterized membrane protein
MIAIPAAGERPIAAVPMVRQVVMLARVTMRAVMLIRVMLARVVFARVVLAGMVTTGVVSAAMMAPMPAAVAAATRQNLAGRVTKDNRQGCQDRAQCLHQSTFPKQARDWKRPVARHGRAIEGQ